MHEIALDPQPPLTYLHKTASHGEGVEAGHRVCAEDFWFLWSLLRICADGCLVDKVFAGDLSLGLILLSWSPLTFRAVVFVSRC